MTSCVTIFAPFIKTLGISNLIVSKSYAALTTTPLPSKVDIDAVPATQIKIKISVIYNAFSKSSV